MDLASTTFGFNTKAPQKPSLSQLLTSCDFRLFPKCTRRRIGTQLFKQNTFIVTETSDLIVHRPGTNLGQSHRGGVVLLRQGNQNAGEPVLQRQDLLRRTRHELGRPQDVVDVVDDLAVEEGDPVVLVAGADLVQRVEQLSQELDAVFVHVVVERGNERADFTDDIVGLRVVRLKGGGDFESRIQGIG